MVMAIAIADAAAVNHSRVVEQRAIAIGRRFQFRVEFRELLHVIAIDLRNFVHQCRVVAMMLKPVVAFRNADLAIRPVTPLARHHERRNPRDVRL